MKKAIVLKEQALTGLVPVSVYKHLLGKEPPKLKISAIPPEQKPAELGIGVRPDLKIEVNCHMCGKHFEKQFKVGGTNDLYYRMNGVLGRELSAETALPELTPEEHELFFISGTCPECWEKLL